MNRFKRGLIPESALGIGKNAQLKKEFNDVIDNDSWTISVMLMIKLLEKKLLKSGKLKGNHISFAGGVYSYQNTERNTEASTTIYFDTGHYIMMHFLENGNVYANKNGISKEFSNRESLGSWKINPEELIHNTADFFNDTYKILKERYKLNL